MDKPKKYFVGPLSVKKAQATYLMRAFLNTCSDFLKEKTDAGQFTQKKFAYLPSNAE